MSKQVQLRRGTTAENDAFTGAVGEVVFDTGRNELRVHDHVTPGGARLARHNYYIAGGTVDEITITTGPKLGPYINGEELVVKVSGANEGAVTINRDGLGAKSVKTQNGAELKGGELVGIHLFIYDGVGFVLLDLSPTMRVMSATISSDQAVSSSVFTKLAFDTSVVDTHNEYDSGLYRWNPKRAGFYMVHYSVRLGSMSDTDLLSGYIAKNGSTVALLHNYNAAIATPVITNWGLIDMNGTTDYVEIFVLHNYGSSRDVDSGDSYTRFAGFGPVGGG